MIAPVSPRSTTESRRSDRGANQPLFVHARFRAWFTERAFPQIDEEQMTVINASPSVRSVAELTDGAITPQAGPSPNKTLPPATTVSATDPVSNLASLHGLHPVAADAIGLAGAQLAAQLAAANHSGSGPRTSDPHFRGVQGESLEHRHADRFCDVGVRTMVRACRRRALSSCARWFAPTTTSRCL